MKTASRPGDCRFLACLLPLALGAILLLGSGFAWAQDAFVGFDGPKTSWHGFNRYDFDMDEQTLDLQPFAAPVAEGDGIQGQTPGKRRCVVVVPQQPAPGNPWSWRGCYWDHQPQTEVALLKRGFCIAYITPDGRNNADPAGRQWRAWYDFLTQKHGLSPKPAFVGMSKGGVNAYVWATANPDKLSCIYADNPALYPDNFAKLDELVKADIPVLHVCGSLDFLLYHHTLPVEDVYHQLGGRISVMIKEGELHHPHSLPDAKPIADWIEQNIHPADGTPFTLPGKTLVKSYYYSFENDYRFFPTENLYITCRGPAFTDCYERYDATVKDWGLTGPTVIVPKTPAPGNPWVFRADRIDRAQPSAVDLGLLAKGFYIVAAPVDLQEAGPVQKEWEETYQLLTSQGFSKKPALEGSGEGACEAYAWAITHPDEVSCIYAQNPLLQNPSTLLPNVRPLEGLGTLTHAGIPVLHVCGSLDPLLKTNSDVVEQQYKQLGGKITVILEDGVGHYPLVPTNPQPVVDFIAENAGK
ncbi:MAG TPA: hypothetical protein VHY09_13385 [Candidatus Methylacidiphilales bacterium]|jgi:pimeloyl-ACP methyl ester carboxylesterase|nr:hypothetical protein [Candidatus Methylacidiphilales bacterium]